MIIIQCGVVNMEASMITLAGVRNWSTDDKQIFAFRLTILMINNNLVIIILVQSDQNCLYIELQML